MTSDNQIVAAGKVVGMYFTLKDERGNVLDSNRRGGKPLAFLHGGGTLLPALEKALEGKRKNDFLELRLAATEAYGERKDELVRKVPRSVFPSERAPAVGMHFSAKDAEGQAHALRVLAVDDSEVTVDENHPLAGQALHFEITICGVRDATAEEQQHGHVHGPGGAHGH